MRQDNQMQTNCKETLWDNYGYLNMNWILHDFKHYFVRCDNDIMSMPKKSLEVSNPYRGICKLNDVMPRI